MRITAATGELCCANIVNIKFNLELECLADDFECENGWKKHGTHCFKAFAQRMHHTEAGKFCQSIQGTLAVPHEDRAIQVLAKMISDLHMPKYASNNMFFWIGLYVEKHKTIKSSDGTTADLFRWLPLGHSQFLNPSPYNKFN